MLGQQGRPLAASVHLAPIMRASWTLQTMPRTPKQGLSPAVGLEGQAVGKPENPVHHRIQSQLPQHRRAPPNRRVLQVCNRFTSALRYHTCAWGLYCEGWLWMFHLDVEKSFLPCAGSQINGVPVGGLNFTPMNTSSLFWARLKIGAVIITLAPAAGSACWTPWLPTPSQTSSL